MQSGKTVKSFIAENESSGFFEGLKSERGKINYFYEMVATEALRDKNGKLPANGKYSYLVVNESGQGHCKKTIMQELGRFENEDIIREVAETICYQFGLNIPMNTQYAVEYIRSFKVERVKKKSEGNEFIFALCDAIDKYKEKYEISDSDIVSQLDHLLSMYEKKCPEYERYPGEAFMQELKNAYAQNK